MVSAAISLIQISAQFNTYQSRCRLQLLSSCYDLLFSISPNSPLSSSALEHSSVLPSLHFSSRYPHSAPTLTFLFCCPDFKSRSYFICNFVRFVVICLSCPFALITFVSNSSLCRTPHCVQLIIVSNLSCCATWAGGGGGGGNSKKF